jgi:hypothetical protein
LKLIKKLFLVIGLMALALSSNVAQTYAYSESLQGQVYTSTPMTPSDFIEVVGDWIEGVISWVGSAVTGVALLFWDTTAGSFTMIGLLALFGLGVSFVGFGIGFLLRFLKK